jgi:hypothetical protein
MSTVAGAALIALLRRKTMRALILVTCLLVYPAIAMSQQSTGSRAQQIAAMFTKHKAVVAVKRGVTREKYKDVRAELAPRNVSEYAGRYEVSDHGWWIEIQVGDDGHIRGRGDEAGQPCDKFELTNATIEGALLTATKVCRNGTVERLEAVFMNRTERVSATDTGTTMFGLGVVLAPPREVDGNTWERVFYRRM